jgi:hypothetical protein
VLLDHDVLKSIVGKISNGNICLLELEEHSYMKSLACVCSIRDRFYSRK